jgi:ribosomal-protein-alanine N-acetyltransferase
MSLPEVRIRPARLEDVESVVALERGIAGAPHWNESEYTAVFDADAVIRRLLVVAENGDQELVGFAVGKVVGPRGTAVGELESVAVAAEARRAGVGRALCEAVVDWCREQGADSAELEVRSASEGAISLYRGLGFETVGLRKGYYRDPVDDAVLMSRVYSRP